MIVPSPLPVTVFAIAPAYAATLGAGAGTGDWATAAFIAFIAGLVAAFIARPQGAGCFGFGCFGNLVIGAVGAAVGRFFVGFFYAGELALLPAFAVSLVGSLLVLYTGQGLDRLLRRGRPAVAPVGPPPQIIEGTAREAQREIDDDRGSSQ